MLYNILKHHIPDMQIVIKQEVINMLASITYVRSDT